ncbi:MAG: isopeptide-forming domain-containing fimbrial protein [Clostridia bacterium]|nr:isopeptide-forming domain-containing fimbrial protein [Clostridia bacterium]
MKNIQKFFAIIMTVALLACLAIPAFAADGSNVLTINGEKTGHTYDAYQIFDGDISAGVLTNISWGDGIDGDAFLASLKADTTEITSSDASEVVKFSKVFASAATASDVASIVKSWTTNGDRLDLFAELAGKHLTDVYKTSVEGADNVYTISGLADGYYLVKDRQGVDEVLTDDFYTKYILSITTSTAINVKGDYPHVDKTVSEELTEGFQMHISDQLNKTHYYRWIGSIPSDIDEYDTYSYKFTDTMSAGLTFERIEQIYIVHAGTAHTLIYSYNEGGSTTVKEDALYPDVETVVVNDNGTAETADDTTTITLGWTDLLSQYPNLKTSDHIYVKYSAHLDNDAVIGKEGNPNEVYINYSNSPSDEGTGKSVPSTAIVYSFALNVVKVDADNNTVVLPGAEFVLYHTHVAADATETTLYAVLDSDMKVQSWTENVDEATILKSGADGRLKVVGLKGEIAYFLRETRAPDGYNKLFTDVKVVLQPGYDAADALISLNYQVDSETGSGNIDDGSIEVTVENNKGTTLPSTGGIGTTIFYIVGTVLVLGAVVLLVTKKRMSVSK